MSARLRWLAVLVPIVLSACQTPGPCGRLDAETRPASQWRPVIERWSEGRSTDRAAGEDRAFYSKRGQLREVWRDLDRDGRTDRRVYFIGDATPARVELDLDFDGAPDLWLRLGPARSVLEARTDSDGDGVPDQVRGLAGVDLAALEALPDLAKLRPAPCHRVPACMAYLEDVTDRVFESARARDIWARVRLSFRLGADGCPSAVEVYAQSNARAARECVAAIEQAAPFPKPPPAAVELRMPFAWGR